MALSNATKEIIRQIGQAPRTSYALSVVTGLNQPSVRATIGRLRKAGWAIASIGTGLDAQYRLVATPAAAAAAGTAATSPQGDGDQGDDFDNGLNAFDTDIDTDEGVL